jgi:multiple sugar transport system substrate-binding protein
MKLKIKTIKILLLMLVMVFVSAGCGGGAKQTGPAGPVSLTVWKTFEDSEHMRPLIDAYIAKHPGAQINYVKKNIENYETDLLNALASGKGPDIFSIHNTWLTKYIDKLEPAPEKLINLKYLNDNFVDVVKEDFVNKNKIYALPLSVDALALYYNKDLLGSAGIAVPARSWQELAEHTRILTKQDSKGYFQKSGVALGLAKNVNRAVDIYYLFMLQLGFKNIGSNEEGFAQLSQNIQKDNKNLEPAVEALDFYSSFADPKSQNYTWNARSDYSIDAFVNGRSAYVFGYSYLADTIRQKAPNLRFDIAFVPQFNLNEPSVNFANYWAEGVSAQSKNKPAAWDFLKFISSKDNLEKYYANHKVPSSRKDLVELQAQDVDMGVFATANLTARSFKRPEQAKYDNIVGNMLDNVILKGKDWTEAVYDAEAQIGTLLRE